MCIGVQMNINLGIPYETIIENIIEKGYAGNQTEVIRQALLAYQRLLDEEEVKLVNRAINIEMDDFHTGKVTVTSFEDLKKKYSK